MPDYPPDELEERPWDDVGRHGRFVPQPDGLDRRCKVCHQPAKAYCVNPITGKPRRGNVSCIGRKERTA